MIGFRLISLIFGSIITNTPETKFNIDYPESLKPYIINDVFDPGDFGWAKGAFEDASLQDKKSFLFIKKWSNDCLNFSEKIEESKLEKIGYGRIKLDTIVAGPAICGQVSLYGMIQDRSSFNTFSENMRHVKPVYDTYLTATRFVAPASDEKEIDFQNQITRRRLAEQMVRAALQWGGEKIPNVPHFSDAQTNILKVRISMEMLALDRANTKWIKDIVVNKGWPQDSLFGKGASHSSWLLVQHADADPAFQITVLNLLKNLVKTREVSGSDYAYLYDRVMLKITGKQRFATQFTCKNNVVSPLPLESVANINQIRSEVGLGSLEKNREDISKDIGKCP